MLFNLVIALMLLYAAVVRSHHEINPVVETSLGRIEGSLMKTRLGKTIYSFRSIRYAKSPEGELRFKNAVPIEPWHGIYDATKEGPACPSSKKGLVMSEDCLRLNVYTNALPTGKKTAKKPVIAFIHPSGFFRSSAQSSNYGPHYLLDQNVVLVTMNYRLGVLGFMSTGDERAPGNLGLKDQVVALRWIRDHIAKFGGNPKSVTLTGCSAGARSVTFHMLSPASKGLFHRGIVMSGAPPVLLPRQQKHLITKQASFVGCPSDNVDNAIECLKHVPYEQLGRSLSKFYEGYSYPMYFWSPVVEPEIPGVERFITDQPENLIRKKQFHPVPLIIGITKDEYIMSVRMAMEEAMEGDDSIFRNTTKNWNTIAPITFSYDDYGTRRSKQISREFYKFYFHNKPITVENGLNFGKIYSDYKIGFPSHRFVQLLSEHSSVPVYYYQFTYEGRLSAFTWNIGPQKGKPLGVAHVDDLIYLYTMPHSFYIPFLNTTDPDTKMIEKLTSMHAYFAKTGKPIPEYHELFKGVHWPRLNPKQSNYLEIGEVFTMKSHMYADRYALWDRLFPVSPIDELSL